MLFGPQTYPMRRELRDHGAVFGPVFGGGGREAPMAAGLRQEIPEPDFMVMAMMTPCCGFGVWPEMPVRGDEDPLRETAAQLAFGARAAWRQAGPSVALAARSGAFLAALMLLAGFGVGILQLFGG